MGWRNTLKIGTKGIFLSLFFLSAIFALFIGNENIFTPFGIGYMVTFLYFYHLKKTNRSINGVKVDAIMFIPPLIFSAIFFIRGLFVDSTIKQCDQDGCSPDPETKICKKDSVVCTTNNMNQSGFWRSPGIVISSASVMGLVFLFYESAHSKGLKDAAVQSTLVLMSMLLVFGIIYTLFEIGNPYYVFTNNEDTETVGRIQGDYIFKGGLRGGILDIFNFKTTEIIYDGNPRNVKIKNGNYENIKDAEEHVKCSHENSGASEKQLWQCNKPEHNRIESKCGGDWWITSNKGCLGDGFTHFYQFIYLLIVSVLVFLSMYSTVSSTSFYSFETFQPLIIVMLTLSIYHITYLSINFFVSWSHGESILFQDFISEFLKGRKGYWTDNKECNRAYATRSPIPETAESSSGTAVIESYLETEYKTIWDKEDATSKFKIIINMVILLSIIGYTVNYTGNKYIQKIINSVSILEGKTKNIYMILITLLISFSIIQFAYLIYSTIMIDECIINRITEVTHKIDAPKHQKYCKGKISDTEAICETKVSKEQCIADSENCIYDNSYTIYELIRCQLDRHGGLLYHIVILLFVPIIFLFIKSANIGEYFK